MRFTYARGAAPPRPEETPEEGKAMKGATPIVLTVIAVLIAAGLAFQVFTALRGADVIGREEVGDRLKNTVWDGSTQTVAFPPPPEGWQWGAVVVAPDGAEKNHAVLGETLYVGDAKAVKVFFYRKGRLRGTAPVWLRKH